MEQSIRTNEIVENKKVCLTDEVICKVISKSIIEITQMSKNKEFEKRCREILQVKTLSLEKKLEEYFLNCKANPLKKRSFLENFFETTCSEKDDVSLGLLIENMENISANALEELDGFDRWQNDISENKEEAGT